jgi:hypothetical protein
MFGEYHSSNSTYFPAVIAGLGPAIPLRKAPLCPIIGMAGSSPAMTGTLLV